MPTNVGPLDRALRIGIGIALLALPLLLASPIRWAGLVGLVPLATGLLRWCPLYTLLGLNTCAAIGPGSAPQMSHAAEAADP